MHDGQPTHAAQLSCASRHRPPGPNLAARANRAVFIAYQYIQQESHLLLVIKKQLILSASEPSISQRSQFKEDTVKPSVPA